WQPLPPAAEHAANPEPGVVLVQRLALAPPHVPRQRYPVLSLPERRLDDPAPDRALEEELAAAAPVMVTGQLRPEGPQLADREVPVKLANQVAQHRRAAVVDAHHVEHPEVTRGHSHHLSKSRVAVGVLLTSQDSCVSSGACPQAGKGHTGTAAGG